MLLLWLTGVSGYARSWMFEHSGRMKRHMFSYKANRRIILGGSFVAGIEDWPFLVAAFAVTAFMSICATSNK